jgi:CheY-like chemotaxis protein
MTNAIKFSPEDSRILVTLQNQGSRLVLQVQDFGQGIKPEFIPHLFDRFTQSDSPGNRRHGGLGLGLSIVKHLVDLHGGEVSATSAGASQGTVMRVELPSEPSGDTLPPDIAETEGGPELDDIEYAGLQGIAVLVVEDDREASEMMTLVLADRGALVRTAPDYDAAVKALQQDWPDVLVSDIGLPGRDGYELIRRVRQLQQEQGAPHLPVIALTAFARPEDRQKTLDAGFDLHLGKPIKPHVLLEAISRFCRPDATT